MTSAAEAASAKTQFGADLAQGLNTLDLNASVTFQQYTRFVLPLDGFIFWLASSAPIIIQGSLHFSTTRQQNEDETIGVNSVIFTALAPIVDFNSISPTVMYLATLPDGVQYAFSQKGNYYQIADAYHYSGTAVLPALQSQIIQNPSGFDRTSMVASNSLPLWLALNSYNPPYPGFTTNGLVLYPSFALPDNLAPPYGVVHIEPGNTEAIQAAPLYDANLSPTQLTEDTVRITIYGLRNSDALNFQDAVLQYSFDTDNFGIMNMPIARDEKRTQVEMAVIAMKKTFSFRISYYQTTVRAVARQLITTVKTTYFPQPLTAVGFVPPAP